jgi:hypothetical protein
MEDCAEQFLGSKKSHACLSTRLAQRLQFRARYKCGSYQLSLPPPGGIPSTSAMHLYAGALTATAPLRPGSKAALPDGHPLDGGAVRYILKLVSTL